MTGGHGDSKDWSGAFAAQKPTGARDVLVGRSGDCGALDELVGAIRQGLSRSLVILGEPGIGKTRLLEYAAQAADGARTVRIAGLESELRLGFAALHRMLVPFLDRVGLLPAPQREALDSVFGLAAGPPPDRFLVSMSVLTLAAEITAEQPLIWLVDDAHWVDRESLEVLGFVGRRLHADKTGLLFCAREASPGLAALDGLPTRHLSGLEPAAARALLAATHSAIAYPSVPWSVYLWCVSGTPTRRWAPVPSRASSGHQLRDDPADAPRDQGTRREKRPAGGSPERPGRNEPGQHAGHGPSTAVSIRGLTCGGAR